MPSKRIRSRVVTIIAQSSSAIDQLHAATKIEACDWGLDLSQGFSLAMPHLTKSREITHEYITSQQLLASSCKFSQITQPFP